MTDPVSHATLAGKMRQTGFPCDPAELHGLLCGVLAAMPDQREALLLQQLARHVDEEQLSASIKGDWQQLRHEVLSAYREDEAGLTLLLPDDGLAARVEALAGWCEGFLAGFGESSAKQKLPDAVNEALEDLVAISQMETPEHDGEEEQGFLSQIEEHCRMLAISIFTDMAGLAQRRKGLH